MIYLVKRMLERWAVHSERGEPVDIYREMIALVVQALGEAMASLDMTGRLQELEPARDTCNEVVTQRHPGFWEDPDRFDSAWFGEPEARGFGEPEARGFGDGARSCYWAGHSHA
jgi:hypothetical protein